LPFPLPLLLISQEPHLGWLALNPPALLDSPEVSIDLDFVQVLLLVFPLFAFELSNIAIFVPPDVIAEVAVERRSVKFKQSHFFIETGRFHPDTPGTPESFQPLNRFVKSVVHQ
jgi:hypothetical protein